MHIIRMRKTPPLRQLRLLLLQAKPLAHNSLLQCCIPLPGHADDLRTRAAPQCEKDTHVVHRGEAGPYDGDVGVTERGESVPHAEVRSRVLRGKHGELHYGDCSCGVDEEKGNEDSVVPA